MANRYGNPTPAVIYKELSKYSVQDMMLWNITAHQPSRLAWWMTSLWLLYGEVYPTHEGMQLKLNANSIEEIKNSLAIIINMWKLFRYDAKQHRYTPVKLPKETSQQFKLRVQRTIRKQVRIWWIVRDLVETYRNNKSIARDKPTPHSNAQFMEQTQCGEQTLTRYLKQITVEYEYALRYSSNGRGQISYFVRPDYDDRSPRMERYMLHKPTRQRRDGKKPVLVPVSKELLKRLEPMRAQFQYRVTER